MLHVGVVTRSFGGYRSTDCAKRMKELGFLTTELCFTFFDANFWQYNGRKDLSGLTDGLAGEIIANFREQGIEIVSLGAFSNLLEPDEQELERIFELYRRYIEIAAGNGIKYVATENGFIPGKRGICAETYESEFSRFAANMKRLAALAGEYGVKIAFEPCVLDLTPSAKRTRDFLCQVEADNLEILLDPANLIAASDEEDMFKYLAPHIAYFHGKDRKVNDAYGRNLGEGDIDWVKFFGLYNRLTPEKPFILEYVNPENCAKVRDLALEFNRRALNGE